MAAFQFIKRLCKSPPSDTSINETTPLLEDNAPIIASPAASVHSLEVNIRNGVPVRPLKINVSSVDQDSSYHDPPTVYFSVDPYCVICRKTFHGHGEQKDLPCDLESTWDRQFIAICPVIIRSLQRYVAVELEKAEEDEMILKPLGLEINTPVLINVQVMTADYIRKASRMPARLSKLYLRQDAYAVHRHCRSLAASVFPDDHIHKLISQYGRSTRFVARIRCCEDTWKGTLQHMGPYLSSLDKTNDGVKLITQLSTFPPELEDEIRNHAKHNLLSNIINFCRSTVPLIRLMSEVDIQIQYLSFKDSKYISVETIPIYESVYFSSLALHTNVSPVGPSSLKIAAKDISGIQISLGDYGGGIQALRFLYRDTTSACIGTASGSSFITQIGTNIAGLKVVKDNLKIITIELIAERTWHLPTRSLKLTNFFPIHPTLKSYMLPNSTTTSLQSFPGWRLKSQESLTKRNFNSWRRSSYHFLPSSEASVESITFYCLKDSVCGIAFEQPSSEVMLIGSRNPLACAIHLELDYLERLGNVLAAIDASNTNRCPPLILATNLSRILSCSPMFQSQITAHTRVFTDGSTHPDGSIKNLGFTFGEVASEPLDHIPNVPRLEDLYVPALSLPDGWRSAFISTATFKHVTEIATCKRGNRVTGLRIRHFDDKVFGDTKPTEILGQFDSSNRSSIKKIYDNSYVGRIDTVIFRYASQPKVGWGDADCEYICGVKVISCENSVNLSSSLPSPEDEDKKKFVIREEQLSLPIAWLFNSKNDHIQAWDGKTKKIEFEDSGPQRELLLNQGLDLPEHQYDPDFVLWDEREGMESEDEDSVDGF